MSIKVLIATGGEIAIRIARTIKDNGLIPIGVYTPSDKEALHRRFMVDDIEISSYEDINEIIYAAQELGADAVHPGYGILAMENEYASLLKRKNIAFIAPPPSVYAITRDKIVAKTYAEKLGIPTPPWREIKSPDDVLEFAREHGYPLILKPIAGKWGIGVRIIRSESEVESMVKSSRSIAEKTFRDPRLYVEPFIENSKHIEVQVLGDRENIIHLYDRECFIGRNFRRLIAEAPSPSLDQETRRKIIEMALTIARSIRLENLATIEFIYNPETKQVFFIEVNPGLTPEHAVTEFIIRRDLVKKQLEVSLYGAHGVKQDELILDGHAIGVNIYAENPLTNEKTTGTITNYIEPGGAGIRVDSELSKGVQIENRDLIARIIAWGTERKTAISRLNRALTELTIEGLVTNHIYLKYLIEHPVFQSADYTISKLVEVDNSITKKIVNTITTHSIVLATLVEFDDEGVKNYVKKPSVLTSILQSEKAMSIKRSAWYYYASVRAALERHYLSRRRHSSGREGRK